MSKFIATSVIRGAQSILKEADTMLKNAITDKGANFKFEFPDTAFALPLIFCFTGKRVETLGQMQEMLDYASSLTIKTLPDDKVFLPFLGEALDAGVATMFAEEIIVAIKYIYGKEPFVDKDGFTYNGFISDTILRNLGIQLVDGRMPGFVVILGAAKDSKQAVQYVRELQQKNILIFLAGESNGNSVTKQLREEKIEIGWDTYIVPLGPDTISTIYALNFAARSTITFGGIKGGDYKRILKYTLDRVHAFAMVLGPLDDLKWATGAGAINFGFPAICDSEVPEIRPNGVCRYEEVVKQLDPKKMVDTCIEVRGLKIESHSVPVPVAYGPAFEGERVRKEDTFLEFGGNKSATFEYATSRKMSEIDDNKIIIDGPIVDDKQGLYPLGIYVEVAGRKMQKDFESILERKIHHFISEAHGIFHMGQRDMNWIRISKEAYEAGFRLEHIAKILIARLHSEFPAIVDKVQITLITDENKVKAKLVEAQKSYKERDERVAGLTDESVELFYSCTLCQSYAPNHVCVITPERLGLCGAYNWLDGKAAYEIDPLGPNQPIKKGATVEPVLGQWEGVNQFVQMKSNSAIEKFNAYSMIVDPMTSCGCFECIVGLVPEANGVMIANRGYTEMTPVGMKFSTLAGSVGGGLQTPGFIGVGRIYITSKKFISADGGLKRVVWMSKELKESLRDKLQKRAEEEGAPDLLDKIADETICTDATALVEFLQKVNHPALTMPSMI